MAKNGWIVPAIAIAGVGTLAYILYQKFGGGGSLLESGANQGNNKTVDQNTQAAGASASTAGQVLPDTQINSIATGIYNAGSSNDGEAVARQLSILVDQGDFNRLYQMFGTKQGSTSMFSTCSLLGFDCQSLDLGAWVNSIVSDSQRYEINANLAGNGINYQF